MSTNWIVLHETFVSVQFGNKKFEQWITNEIEGEFVE